jgi:exopolyphosphatase/guanosine-5'-triphosphate,3'-diphosphate pyrophosphatase
MKIASIDIGTNTVILLIAEIRKNKIYTLLNEYRIPRIGKGLEINKCISNEKISELFQILNEFNDIIKSYKCEVILATGTNAFRISSNATQIVMSVKDKIGIQIDIVSGVKEAEYSFMGAVSDYYGDEKDNVVIDIGGGSTEIIAGKNNKITYLNSFQTGVVTGTERFFKHDPPLPEEIKDFESFLSSIFTGLDISRAQRTIAIAGTPTTLVCIQKGLPEYNEDEVEGSILKRIDIAELKERLSYLSSKQIREKYLQVVSGREDVLLTGTIILYKIMEMMNLSEVIVSTKGIRYGVISEFIKTYKQKSVQDM